VGAIEVTVDDPFDIRAQKNRNVRQNGRHRPVKISQNDLQYIDNMKILERLSCELQVHNRKNKTKAQCRLVLHRSMGRYVKELKSGKLKIDKPKVTQDEKLDDKYLPSTSDQHLSAEDIALGYKQLLEVGRAFKTLNSTLCPRPVYHYKDERIHSHVLLCWLALLLVRIAEVEPGISWLKIRRAMQRLHLGELLSKKNTYSTAHRTDQNQQNILKPLKIEPPKRILNIDFET